MKPLTLQSGCGRGNTSAQTVFFNYLWHVTFFFTHFWWLKNSTSIFYFIHFDLLAGAAAVGSQAESSTHVCGLRPPSRPLSSRPAAAAGFPVTDSPCWTRKSAKSCKELKQSTRKASEMKVGGTKDLVFLSASRSADLTSLLRAAHVTSSRAARADVVFDTVGRQGKLLES